MKKSFYCARMQKGLSTDWLFDVDDDKRVTAIYKGGTDKFNMIGISHFLQADMEKVLNKLEEVYNLPSWKDAFWDMVVNELLAEIDVGILELTSEDVIEIDSVEELQAIDASYK